MEPDLLSTWLPLAAEENRLNFMPANGTGILPTIDYIKQHHPEAITPEKTRWLGAELPNIVGAYPQDTFDERALCNFYTSSYFILLTASLLVFCIGYKRGHFFYPLLLVCVYCTFCGIGFICRQNWGRDLSNIHTGVASIVLCQFGEYLLVLNSLIFAHRLCSWRSPRRAWSFDIFTIFYGVGAVSYFCSIVGQILPYYLFLTQTGLNTCRSLLMAGSFLELIFAIVPFPLVYMAAILRWNTRLGGGSERKYPIYQADWVESANIFSYPIPIHRTINRQLYPHVAVVMPTYELPADGKNRMLSKPMLPGSPRVLMALIIVISSSLCLVTAPIVRILSNTLTNSRTSEYIVSLDPLVMGHTYFPQSPAALWIFFGGIQMCVVVGWLVLRVDLRFYIPPIFWRDNLYERTERQKLYEALA